MRLRIATQLALWIVAMAVLGYGQSLGDVAKKEKERREKMKAGSRVITNDDTVKYANGPVTTTTPPAPPAAAPATAKEKEKAEPEKPGETPKAAAGAKANPDEPTDLQGRPESFWRQTFADARQKVKELENKENVLVLKVNDLQNRFFRTDDGFQRQAIQAELQKTFTERDQTSADLAKAKAQLDDLEKDARKSGALPGWIAAKP